MGTSVWAAADSTPPVKSRVFLMDLLAGVIRDPATSTDTFRALRKLSHRKRAALALTRPFSRKFQELVSTPSWEMMALGYVVAGMLRQADDDEIDSVS